MDSLSAILQSVQLEGALYIRAEFTAPWCIRGRHGAASIKERLAGAEHVIFFHYVTEGRCQIRLVDEPQTLEVGAGELVLFAQDDRHLMGSDIQLAPLDTDDLARPTAADEAHLIELRHGGDGAVTRFVCGYLACGRSQFRMLLGALPRLLHVPFGDGRVAALVRELLGAGVHLSWAGRPGTAATQPGAGSTLTKVADLLFVEAIRRYVELLPPHGPPQGSGLLAAVRDAHIGRALALLHEDPERDWTLSDLAREVALSRSGLAKRFTELVGDPPIQYLTRWRLAIAARALRSGQEAVGRIAERSGYESDAAFSRAFKREFGVPPAAWRKAGDPRL